MIDAIQLGLLVIILYALAPQLKQRFRVKLINWRNKHGYTK